ncbi:MAG: hypothetical protein AAF329_12875, partial [Cyanobacteria bacterium P01_A01_bin.17]
AGAGLVLKGLKAGSVLAKFPRLVKLAKRIGRSGVVRAGIKVFGKITDVAGNVVQRARAIAQRARRLLPDFTSNAKVTRQLDEFEAFDLSITDQKKIVAKLDELDLTDQKLELALEQAAGRPDLVEKLAKDLEKTADDLEDLVNRNSPNAGKVPTRAKALKEIEQNRHLIRLSSMDGYTYEIPLPEGHFWRRTPDGTWCRFSDPVCNIDTNFDDQLDELVGQSYLDYFEDLNKQGIRDNLPEGTAKEIPRESPRIKFVHDRGVERGKITAMKDDLTPRNQNTGEIWVNPYETEGPFGRGIDDIMFDSKSGDPVILEYKGGKSDLNGDQMKKSWVCRKIRELHRVNDPMANILQNAMLRGTLKGKVYRTPVDDVGNVGNTYQDGPDISYKGKCT